MSDSAIVSDVFSFCQIEPLTLVELVAKLCHLQVSLTQFALELLKLCLSIVKLLILLKERSELLRR